MDTLVAKHKVGEPIHVRLWFGDDRASMTFYGGITASRIEKHTHFSDQIHYDLYLEQAEAPPIQIQNLPQGFVLAGGVSAEPVEETA